MVFESQFSYLNDAVEILLQTASSFTRVSVKGFLSNEKQENINIVYLSSKGVVEDQH